VVGERLVDGGAVGAVDEVRIKRESIQVDDGHLDVRNGKLAALYQLIEDGGEEGEEASRAEFVPCGPEFGEAV
jgi:hypothetical protein